MNRTSAICLAVALPALAAIMQACVSDDTDFSDIIDSPSAGLPQPMDIDLDFSPLAEAPETVPPGDNDYVENSEFDYDIDIVFDGDSVTVTGDTDIVAVSCSGAHVMLRAGSHAVRYTVTGHTGDGSLKFYSSKKFMLVLDGADIANPRGAAVNNQCGKSMFVVLAHGSHNALTDGSSYDYTPSEDMKGALFSEGQIIFSGSGSLAVNANCRNGIASDDYIVVRPGSQISVTATRGHGMKANDGVTILGSAINILSTADGCKGINSEAFVTVGGGRTCIVSTGRSVAAAGDTTTCACIKADSTLTVERGVLSLKATGEGSKGINAARSVFIEGGALNVVATGAKGLGSPKGVKSDGDIVFSGGSSYIFSLWSKPVDAAGDVIVAPGCATLEQTASLWLVAWP